LDYPKSAADQAGEFAGVVVEAGEDWGQVADGDVFVENFAEDGTEVGGEREVAAIV
jgi:hypothetical protein